MKEQTIVIVRYKDDMPLAYLVDGNYSECDGKPMNDELINVFYPDNESKEPFNIGFGDIATYVRSFKGSLWIICVGEE